MECNHCHTDGTFLLIDKPFNGHTFKPADYPDAIVISSILYVSNLTGLCSFVLNFLIKNYRLVEDRDYQQRFRAFFTNAEIYNNPKAAYYSFVFLLHHFSWLSRLPAWAKSYGLSSLDHAF